MALLRARGLPKALVSITGIQKKGRREQIKQRLVGLFYVGKASENK